MINRLSFFHTNTEIHYKITPDHLYKNTRKLLTEEEIAAVIQWFEKNPDQNRHKIFSANGEHYNVVKLFDSSRNSFTYHAIYYGEKQGKLLGKGASVKAKLMQELKTGRWNAIRIQKDFNSHDEILFEEEKDTLLTLGMFVGEATRTDKKHKLIGMELVSDITVLEFIQQNPDLSDDEWLQIAINMAKAVHSLHQKNKLHCDIKPNNMMIDSSFNIKLIDFQHAVSTANPIRKRSYGADAYKALELKNEEGPYIYSQQTDLTATGLSIGHLLNAIYFHTGMRHEFYLNGFRFRSLTDTYLEQNCKLKDKTLRDKVITYLQKTTDAAPEKRGSFQQLIEHLEAMRNQFKNETTARRLSML